MRHHFDPSVGAASQFSLRQAALVIGCAVIPYLNALNCGFTWDDQSQILGNPAVVQARDGWLAFSMPLVPGNLYRPLTTASFTLNHALAGQNAAAFHATNILLHAVTSLLVYVFGLQLFQSTAVALVGAVLFAVHPIHTEAVTSLVGRAEVLVALFGLLALISALRMRAAPAVATGRAWHALSVVGFGGALLCKESALVLLPLLVLGMAAARRGRLWDGLAPELRSLDWFPFAAIAALFLVLRNYVVGGASGTSTVTPLDNILAFVAPGVRLRSAFGVLWDYFALLNVPLLLSSDYSHAQLPLLDSWWSPRCAGGVLLSAGSLAALWWGSARVGFVTAFPLIALAISANLLFPIGTPKAERFLYLPSVGWTLAMAYGLVRVTQSRNRQGPLLLLVLVACALATRTWIRNADSRNGATLSLSAVHVSPRSAKARFNYGIALLTNDHVQAAVHELKRAWLIYPFWHKPAFHLGTAYERLRQPQRALQWYRHAAALAPRDVPTHRALCRMFTQSQDWPPAAAACRRALKYAPGSMDLLQQVAIARHALGDRASAIAYLEYAVAVGGGAPARAELERWRMQ